MENKIKELIEIYKARKAANVAVYLVVEDLTALLEFEQKNCCGKTSAEGIKEVYERFKHLDMILSDILLMHEDNSPFLWVCYELWRAVKNECT